MAVTQPDPTTPRVYVTVPGVEDLTSIIVMLRAAGAQITTGYREFEIAGPLTAAQAAAVWKMAGHVDSGSDRNRLGVRVDPAGDLTATLDTMCPNGWSPEAFSWANEDDDFQEADRWWMDQQDLQRQLRRAPKPTTPPAAPPPVADLAVIADDGTCCGQGGTWATAGQPRVGGCQLCPNSPTYWRSQGTASRPAR